MPQFGGAAEKCAVCNKTVYLAEKIVVEDKEDKKTFHKTCLKCSHCKVTLTLGNYASMQGIFYCKPHFKQLFATKGNYDEGFGKDKHTKNWTPQAISAAPASFVPVDKEEGAAAAASQKKETPSSIASKFGRTTLNSEKCHVCNKTVYATEKTVIEDKEDKKVFHKTCLKCSHCGVIVTLGNYASMQGVVYCKPHFKQLFAAKGNYDEGFGKEKASSKWDPQVNAAPNTFVPVDKDEGSKEKKAAPEGIANRFKGTAANTEKCGACGKTVYATERIVVEDKEDKQTFHKACLRCSHCQVVLTLGNYASMQGVYYCKPHFKQLFAAKGNYDEGFGKEKHTKKWSEKDGEPGAPSSDKEEKETAAEPEEDPQELEREIENEKRRQQEEKERELERQREEKDREEAEERERVEKETRIREQRAREEREEREREEREELEREAQEAQERKRLEEQLEKEHEHEHEHNEEEHHHHHSHADGEHEHHHHHSHADGEEHEHHHSHADGEEHDHHHHSHADGEEHEHHHSHADGEEHEHHHSHADGEEHEHHHHHSHADGEEHEHHHSHADGEEHEHHHSHADGEEHEHHHHHEDGEEHHHHHHEEGEEHDHEHKEAEEEKEQEKQEEKQEEEAQQE